MAKKDVPEEESVEESKDDISADVLKSINDTEVEDEKEQSADVEEESGEDSEDEDADEDALEGRTDHDDETDGEDAEDGLDPVVADGADAGGVEAEPGEEPAPEGNLAAESPDTKLDPPEHWSAVDKERFSAVPKEAQEFILDRHKSMEGDYTRKSQEIASIKRQHEAVQDALAPYEAEFAASGLDHAGAVRQLAHWHQALKTGGKAAVLSLAQTYGIDLDEESEYTDPALSSIQQELRTIKEQTHRQTQEAQRQQQDQLLRTIEAFENEKDTSGKLAHPHFRTLQDDITKLFQAGIASDLNDGYSKALALRPDLTTPPAVKKPIPKVDKAEQVRKAKKAATGVKSSGAVGKKSREGMTLEQEIASQL